MPSGLKKRWVQLDRLHNNQFQNNLLHALTYLINWSASLKVHSLFQRKVNEERERKGNDEGPVHRRDKNKCGIECEVRQKVREVISRKDTSV